MKKVIIIGAGPGGLTNAMILANRGFDVTVYEANTRVGGRNRAIQLGSYTFDTGPTFLMLRSILDEVFKEAGSSTDERMDMRRLEPMYRLQFGDKKIEPTTDRHRMLEQISEVFPGHESNYSDFMNAERVRFERLFPCLQKSYHKLSTYLHKDLLRAIPHLSLTKTLHSVMFDRFQDEQLALSFTFQSKYIGMSPWECPGLFSMIPYIEHAYGIYHPIGGLSRISETMADVASERGAKIHTGVAVKRVIVEGRTVKGVELEDGSKVEADDVVINADFGHAMTHLFDPGLLRKYTPEALKKKKFSCSTFMLYLGLDKLYDAPHHAVCFADDYRKNVETIFSRDHLSKDISFYVRNASVTDKTLAPEGHSAVYVLVPAPNLRGETDWDAEKMEFRDTVIDLMEARMGMNGIREHIKEELIIAPPDWERDHFVYEGATFNLAHNLGQMLHLRPHNKFEEFDHCYLVGGGTHPGSGLPTIYESGRIVANLISEHYGVPFVSPQLTI